MNKLKSILRILISLILLLEYVQSNCPIEKEWREFKTKYSISFYNSTLELQA